jgi:non-ribosomal peptide synthetase component E (peptide arylation enzyme)
MAIEVSMNPTFLTGGKVVMSPSTETKDILEAIQKEKVTTMILVVAQAQRIVDEPDLCLYDLTSLQVIGTAGSHAPSGLIRKIRERLGCKFFNVYGMSEGPCTQTRYDDPEEVIFHTVGRQVCPYDEFKVIDSRGCDLPPGEEGELVARGPCIFRGYYKSEADNREAFTSDGFFRTGDIAKFDSEGHLVITGRRKDIIIRGGVNISPTEIEELISDHPDVEQVAVVGMPDPVFGERVCAFIKLRKGVALSAEGLIAFLKERKMSALYLPEWVEVVDDIPLTNVGKPDKARLREEIRQKTQGQATDDFAKEVKVAASKIRVR